MCVRCGEMAAEVERLQGVIDEANAQGPVAIVRKGGDSLWAEVDDKANLKHGDSLYAYPLPAQAIPEWMPIETMPNNRTLVQVYCEGADCVGIAHKTSDGKIVMPEPQAIGYDSLTHWKPLSAPPKS